MKKVIWGLVALLFTMSVLYANSGDDSDQGKFWGSTTTCGPCNDVGLMVCVTTYQVFWVTVNETVTVVNC